MMSEKEFFDQLNQETDHPDYIVKIAYRYIKENKYYNEIRYLKWDQQRLKYTWIVDLDKDKRIEDFTILKYVRLDHIFNHFETYQLLKDHIRVNAENAITDLTEGKYIKAYDRIKVVLNDVRGF